MQVNKIFHPKFVGNQDKGQMSQRQIMPPYSFWSPIRYQIISRMPSFSLIAEHIYVEEPSGW